MNQPFGELPEYELNQMVANEDIVWHDILIQNLMQFKPELPKQTGNSLDNDRDIVNFKNLLKDAGIYPFIKQKTIGIDAVKHFLGCFIQNLHEVNTDMNTFFDTHIYLRMIWVMDNCENIETMLQAFVLAACECERGEYDKHQKTNPKPPKSSKLPRFFLHEILLTELQLDWFKEEDRTYTKMAFNRDINWFKEGILAKENLCLDDSTSSPSENMVHDSLMKSYFYDLSTYARLGREYRMETKIYQRMMKVVCSSTFSSYEDVLKAFLMSMCKYRKSRENQGEYKKK